MFNAFGYWVLIMEIVKYKYVAHAGSNPALATNFKIMKKDKSWLIFPMFTYTKYSDGTNKIGFGWLNRTYWVKW